MMDYVPLNFDLMKHPSNWFILVLMVLIASVGIDIVLSWLRHNQKEV